MTSLLPNFFNLAILLGLLVYYLREPLATFIASRHTTLKDELHKTRDQLRKSQERFDEFSGKLKAIDAEIVALRDQAKLDAETSKVRITTEAKRLSTVIVADARTTAESVFGELKTSLRVELANRVLERAEALLRERLTGDDRVRIRRDFATQLERTQ